MSQVKHFEQFEKRKRAALVVLDILRQRIPFGSVLDVGCGVGAWLVAARELGADVVCGVDGPWIDPSLLGVDASEFVMHDLNTSLDLHRKFDLVVSIEVGEHLKPESSQPLVKSMVRHGDVILFSAALPGQGGAGHINEQWPEFWVSLFRNEGYEAYDLIRRLTWGNNLVFPWIQQNCFLLIRKGVEIPKQLRSYRVGVNVPTMVHRVTYSRLLKKLDEAQQHATVPLKRSAV